MVLTKAYTNLHDNISRFSIFYDRYNHDESLRVTQRTICTNPRVRKTFSFINFMTYRREYYTSTYTSKARRGKKIYVSSRCLTHVVSYLWDGRSAVKTSRGWGCPVGWKRDKEELREPSDSCRPQHFWYPILSCCIAFKLSEYLYNVRAVLNQMPSLLRHKILPSSSYNTRQGFSVSMVLVYINYPIVWKRSYSIRITNAHWHLHYRRDFALSPERGQLWWPRSTNVATTRKRPFWLLYVRPMYIFRWRTVEEASKRSTATIVKQPPPRDPLSTLILHPFACSLQPRISSYILLLTTLLPDFLSLSLCLHSRARRTGRSMMATTTITLQNWFERRKASFSPIPLNAFSGSPIVARKISTLKKQPMHPSFH